MDVGRAPRFGGKPGAPTLALMILLSGCQAPAPLAPVVEAFVATAADQTLTFDGKIYGVADTTGSRVGAWILEHQSTVVNHTWALDGSFRVVMDAARCPEDDGRDCREYVMVSWYWRGTLNPFGYGWTDVDEDAWVQPGVRGEPEPPGLEWDGDTLRQASGAGPFTYDGGLLPEAWQVTPTGSAAEAEFLQPLIPSAAGAGFPPDFEDDGFGLGVSLQEIWTNTSEHADVAQALEDGCLASVTIDIAYSYPRDGLRDGRVMTQWLVLNGQQELVNFPVETTTNLLGATHEVKARESRAPSSVLCSEVEARPGPVEPLAESVEFHGRLASDVEHALSVTWDRLGYAVSRDSPGTGWSQYLVYWRPSTVETSGTFRVYHTARDPVHGHWSSALISPNDAASLLGGKPLI